MRKIVVLYSLLLVYMLNAMDNEALMQQLASYSNHQVGIWFTRNYGSQLSAFNSSGNLEVVAHLVRFNCHDRRINTVFISTVLSYVTNRQQLRLFTESAALSREIAIHDYLRNRKNSDFSDALITGEFTLTIQDSIDAEVVPAINHGMLDLSHCHLDSLEGLRDIPGIHTVTRLDVSHNQLTSLPIGMGGFLTAIEYVSADHNRITELHADTFTGCTRLKTISITHNRISQVSKTFHDITRGCRLYYTRYDEPIESGDIFQSKSDIYTGTEFAGFNADLRAQVFQTPEVMSDSEEYFDVLCG